MKKIFALVILTALLIIGCKEGVNITDPDKIVKKPTANYLSEDELQGYINKQLNVAIDFGNEFVLAEAANALYLTRNAISAIRNEEYGKARGNLAKAIAKTELMLMSSEKKVTAEVKIAINKGVENATQAYHVINEIDSLVKVNGYQQIKQYIHQLSNEITITRESLVLASFLKILKAGEARLIAKDYEGALLQLSSIENSTIVEQSVVPIPILRAEKNLIAAKNLSEADSTDYKNISVLLDNTEYELNFAELLGYGNRESDFAELYNIIAEIRNSLTAQNLQATQKQINELTNELKKSKKEISEFKTEKHRVTKK